MIAAAAETFARLGVEIVPVDIPPEIAYGNAFTSMIAAVEGYGLHAKWLAERFDDYGRQTRARLMTGAMVPASRYAEARALRGAITRAFVDAVFGRCDALLAPVLMTRVPTLAEADMAANPGFMKFITRVGHATRPVNYMGLPSLTLPNGFDADGLPMAFQLIGRPFDEAMLYRVGRTYERETGCTDPAPVFDAP